MRAATVEDITASIARRILWNTFFERETENPDHQRPLAVILGESSRTILWMRNIDIVVRCLISVSTVDCRTFDTGKLRQFGQSAQHIHHIRIREHLIAHFQQVTKILNGRRNTVKEMLLALEITTETVSSQHL